MDLEAVRALFPVTRNVTYLNHAAVGPLSTRAAEAMERHARDQRDFGATHWREWYAEHAAVRESAARLIGAKPTEVSILKNTTEGLAFVAEGLRWKSGENVVTSSLEFPSNYAPWMNLRRRGVECRIARGREGTVTVDDIARVADANTRLVTVSSVAFHNGFAADLEAIGEYCAANGILFCVDAIQSVGVLPIDVRRTKIAFLAADGHKWMCAAEGAAVFFVAEEHRDRLDVIEHGWMNVDRKGRFIEAGLDVLPDSRRFEAGSLNTNGIYGLRAAIDLLLEIGIERIRDRALALAARLADGAEDIGLHVATPPPIASAIVGVTPPDVEKASLMRLHRLLEDEGIVCAPREGLLRFSPHFYNDEDEIDRTLAVLARITR